MSFYKHPPGAFSLTSGIKVNASSASSKDVSEDTTSKPKAPPVVPPKPQSLVSATSGSADIEGKSKPLPQPPKPIKGQDPVETDNTLPVSSGTQLPVKPPKPPRAKRLSRVLNLNDAIELRDSVVSSSPPKQVQPPQTERTSSLSSRNISQAPVQRKPSVSTSSAVAPVSTPSHTPNEDLQKQLELLQRENEELKTINSFLDKREKELLESQQINQKQIELQRTDIEKLKSAVVDYAQKITSLNSINKRLTEASTSQTKMITSLQNEISQLKSELTVHHQQEQEITRLKHQLTATQRETQTAYEESIKKLQEQVEEQEQQLASEKKKSQLLQQLNEDLEEKLKLERQKASEKKVDTKPVEKRKSEEKKQDTTKVQEVTKQLQQAAPVVQESVKTSQSHDTVKLVKVVFAYEAKDEDEITLEVGELIRVSRYDPETGWSEGTNSKGASGLFPNNFVLIITQEEPKPITPVEPEPSKIVKPDQPVITLVRALYAYNKTEEDEISFEKGDVIEVIQRDDDSGWWFGRLQKNGQEGLFPDNYVKEVK